MRLVELQNAGSFKLDKIAFDADKIECIQKPISEAFGCIVVVKGQRYPVKDDYDAVKEAVFGYKKEEAC